MGCHAFILYWEGMGLDSNNFTVTKLKLECQIIILAMLMKNRQQRCVFDRIERHSSVSLKNLWIPISVSLLVEAILMSTVTRFMEK